MKKFALFLAIALGCILLWAGSTLLVSRQAEKHFYRAAEQLSAMGSVKIAVKSYERGFLRSRAATVGHLDILLPAAGEGEEPRRHPLVLTMRHDLRHGPLPAGRAGDGRFHWLPMLALVETTLHTEAPAGGVLHDLLAHVPELAAWRDTTTIHLNGGGRSRTEIPPFEKQLPDDGLVTWQGLESDLRFSRDFSRLAGHLLLPGAALSGGGTTLQIADLQVRYDLQRAFDNLYIGDTDAGLSHLHLQFDSDDEAASAFTLQGLQAVSYVNRKGELIDYGQTVSISSLVFDEEEFGPGAVEVYLHNLHGPAMSQLQDRLQQLQRDVSAGDSSAETVRHRQQELGEALIALTKGSPELEFRRLALQTPFGDFRGRARFRLLPGEDVTLPHPIFLLQRLEAEVDLSVAEQLLLLAARPILRETLVRGLAEGEELPLEDPELDALIDLQIGSQLQELAGAGILLQEKGFWVLRGSYHQGQLLINGREVPLFGQ